MKHDEAVATQIDKEIATLRDRQIAALNKGQKKVADALRAERDELVRQRPTGNPYANQLTEARQLLRGTEAEYFNRLSAAASARREYQAMYDIGVDEVFGTAATDLEVEHVYPRSKIFLTPGFEKLTWEEQIYVLNYRPNLKLISAEMNRVRGNRTYRSLPRTSWPQSPRGDQFVESQIKYLAVLESMMEAEITNLVRNPNRIPSR
jgi:hypothetical protein